MAYSPEAAQQIHTALRERGWVAYETRRLDNRDWDRIITRGTSPNLKSGREYLILPRSPKTTSPIVVAEFMREMTTVFGSPHLHIIIREEPKEVIYLAMGRSLRLTGIQDREWLSYNGLLARVDTLTDLRTRRVA